MRPLIDGISFGRCLLTHEMPILVDSRYLEVEVAGTGSPCSRRERVVSSPPGVVTHVALLRGAGMLLGTKWLVCSLLVGRSLIPACPPMSLKWDRPRSCQVWT